MVEVRKPSRKTCMNNYKIIDKIGEGAHGVVLKAYLITTGQTVALKKIPLRNFNGASNATPLLLDSKKTEMGGGGGNINIPNNIIREIKSLQQLSHPNVSLREPLLHCLKNVSRRLLFFSFSNYIPCFLIL